MGGPLRHEQLARLSAECGGHVDLSVEPSPRTREELIDAAALTEQAMSDGVPLIFQAQFFDGTWQGRADFLRRTSTRSKFGDWSYEVLDTKLARQVKPTVVHQLSLYNRLLTAVQEFEQPYAYVVLGDGSTVPIDLRRYAALHRHLAHRLLQVVSEPAMPTYPDPVARR